MVARSKTDTDDTAARTSARDAWVKATRHYFVEACAHWRSHPDFAMTRVRPIVEGFVHIVCVDQEMQFEPYERRELRRLPLERATAIAKRYLPPERNDLVSTLKNLGNAFHHNQGVVQRCTPTSARVALLQCAELLDWLDRERLGDPLPLDYVHARRDLDGTPSGRW